MTEDAHLIGRIVAGDTLAFGQWVAGVDLPLRLSLRAFAAAVDVEAVVQEALLRVWQVAPRFQPDGKPNALLRFAVTTARNVAVSELRRAPPPRESLDALAAELGREPSVEAVAPDPHLRGAVAECHQKLPGQPKAALAARLESGGADDDSALAERLNMKLNTFLQNVTRARRLLAECLEGLGVDLDAELT